MGTLPDEEILVATAVCVREKALLYAACGG